VVTLTSKDKINAMAVNIVAIIMAIFLDILPDARGLFGLSLLSIS
jgi:hypothetical protein